MPDSIEIRRYEVAVDREIRPYGDGRYVLYTDHVVAMAEKDDQLAAAKRNLDSVARALYGWPPEYRAAYVPDQLGLMVQDRVGKFQDQTPIDEAWLLEGGFEKVTSTSIGKLQYAVLPDNKLLDLARAYQYGFPIDAHVVDWLITKESWHMRSIAERFKALGVTDEAMAIIVAEFNKPPSVPE